jgi:alkylated DNA repair dioxygenase AlkB
MDNQISGLYYFENILDESSANTLLNNLDNIQNNYNGYKGWKPITQHPNSRKVQHFGYIYDYLNGNTNTETEKLPEFLEEIKNKLNNICSSNNIPSINFNQCIVNNYEPGQGISKHIDSKAYGPIVASFSLNSGSYMTFRNGANVVKKYIKPNSVYIMTGDARYKWTHEMPSTKSDKVDDKKILRSRRVSITFRNVPNKP